MLKDVPSPIDLRSMPDALAWEQSANEKRPWRAEFFAKFSEELSAIHPKVTRVLELGSGPGFLAEHLLKTVAGLSYVLLDFSPAMHQLAKARLTSIAAHAQFVERSFRGEGWVGGLGKFNCVVTHQAVHELRHKQHAVRLHEQVLSVLSPGGSYLVCDHFYGEGGMANGELYMSIQEQAQALLVAGFSSVRQVMVKGGLVLHHAT